MARHAFHPGSGGEIARLREPDHRHESLCFADEIVIDFPSMAHAVDRMRRGFLLDERLAERPTPLQLSRTEARDGVVVPLAVPVRCTCACCDGRGEHSGGVCAACGGAGTELRQRAVRVSVPPGIRDGDRFHFSMASSLEGPTRVELQIRVA